MSMHRTRFLAAIAGLLLFAGAGSASAQDTIRCESKDGQYRSCSISTAGGVTLSRQLSSQGCWQNDTWGYDRNRIWVNRGCRAEFRVGSSHNSGDGAKVAGALVLGAIAAAAIANSQHKSNDNNRNYNSTNYNNNYNNGNYNSNYNSNYGNYNNAYNYGYGGYGQDSRPARDISCASRNGRYTTCGYVDRRSHVEIRKQQSNAACIYGRSWGVDGTQLWVSDGCRATFVAY